MPIKRSAEEGGRPPLARGSACHRCFSRKVRCSGQPDPSTGMHACTSCLRTARFKGHDLAVARCAFNGEGLCSEEGGPTMTGEVYANAGPAPRRKLGARSHTTSSARSLSSTSSVTTSDFSFDSPALGSTISPVSSTASLKSLVDAAASSTLHGSTAPSPEHYHLPPPVTFQLPPALPPGVPYAAQHPPPPTHLSMPHFPLTTTSLPSDPAPNSPNMVTPTAANPNPASSILARRSKAAPMSIALPPHPAQAMGLSPVVSRAPSPVAQQHQQQQPNGINSAPLAPPASWGQAQRAGGPATTLAAAHPPPPASLSFPPSTQPSQHPPLHLPPPSSLVQPPMNGGASMPGYDPLAGAMQSVLTPGTLAKLPHTGPTSSYDFSLAPDGLFPPYASGAPPTPSLGVGLGATSYPLGGITPSASAGGPLPTPLRSLSISELYPPSYTPGGGQPGLAGGLPPPGQPGTYAASGQGPEFDPSQWTGSFHLPSPGLTFSSSTPFWYNQPGQGQGQYFART
ncbi:hypothetical protein JCM8097_003751 [Rhodosporidiobolus ruineniae]